MSTAAVVPSATLTNVAATDVTNVTNGTPAAAVQKPGFVRFIDKIGHFFVKEGPSILKVAVDAEPILALTPFGPEYALVVNSIVNVQKVAVLSAQAGAALTSEQKMAFALASVMPALTEILKTKGVTDDMEKAIGGFVQAVYDLHAGPSVVTPALPAQTGSAS